MPTRKLPPTETIIEEYRSGMSTGEIAEKHGVRPSTVVGCLRRACEPRRSAQDAATLKMEHGRFTPTRYWQGKKQPPEMVERRISKIRGEQHWLWKGGASRRHYRGTVVKEQCASCRSKINLCIHHKDLDHYNNTPDNLDVLCVSCHLSLHKTAYWEAYRNGQPLLKSNCEAGWTRPQAKGQDGGNAK